LTTGQSQSTPANNAREDAPTQAPTSGGVGAGTSSNAYDSRGPDNNPGPNTAATQQALAVFSTSNANQLIPTQPNQLDQYASYTYSISWYLLSPAQFTAMVKAQKANVTGWQLLMQSGGAAAAGAGIVLDNYNSVKTYVSNGKLLNSILQNGKASSMPKGGGKLDNCTLSKFSSWINQGALNN
jgi:hypothetical protein